MMADEHTTHRTWDRWEWLWHGVFGVTLVVPTAIAIARPQSAGSRALTAAVAGAFAAWYWLLPVRHPQWAQQVKPHLVYLVGAAAFTLVLVERDEAFLFLIYGLYPQMFVLLGRWGAAAAVVVTVLVLPRAVPDGPPLGVIVWIAGSAALAVVLGLFITAIAKQSEDRKQALDELAATRSGLADAARRAGVLEERQRMAREIHDTVAQGLSSIVMLLEAAEAQLGPAEAASRDHLGQAKHTAREGLRDLRRSVLALRPDELQTASLPAALEVVVQRWEQRAGIATTLRVLGEPYTLHPETEVALLRTAQEALANVAKHAAANEVTVTLTFHDDETTLDISDDGRGITSKPRAGGAKGGFGLVGLRQRVGGVGGRLAVDSSPDAGTRLEAAVPRVPQAAE